MRVLHVLHHSTPYLDGYGVRSKYIVDFQRRIGLDPIVVTSAQHEVEMGRARHDAPVMMEEIDGTRYYRTSVPTVPEIALRTPVAREGVLMTALAKSARRIAKREGVDVIHAHSPALCGLPALLVGRVAGTPMVYEVRSFWEDGFAGDARSLKYRVSRAVETAIFRAADATVFISNLMLEDAAARGVDRQKLVRVPNGVDAEKFVPREKDTDLLRQLQLEGRPVAGFIGSFASYEGIPTLLDAMNLLRRRLPDARLLLVGAGEQADIVREKVATLGLEREVILTGLVPHNEIPRYYSILDVVVYPRRSDRTTESVTPLKPLEAMAMGRAVLGSDVAGIRELLNGGRVGVLFTPGNEAELADRLESLLLDDEFRDRVAEQGRQFATSSHDWSQVVKNYVHLYESLVGGSARAVASQGQ